MKISLKCIFKDGTEREVNLNWDSCVALGYTGRNREAVLAHIEELRKLGVPAPQKIPATYWIDPERVTTERHISVIGNKTSGEVEIFIAKDNEGEIYITVGSDHTDRDFERTSVSKAKQICSKVIAPACWSLKDVKDHWDELILRMEVKREGEKEFTLYQEGDLSRILAVDELLNIAYSERPPQATNPSIFSGTVPLLTKETIFANVYKMTLIDPILKREISHTYEVIVLPDKI